MSKNMKLNTGDKVIYWPLGRGKPGYCATAVVGGFEGDFCILYPRVDLPGGGRSPVLGMRYSLTEGAIADGSTVALWDGTEEHFMTLRERARKDAGTAGQTGPTNHSGLPGVAGLSGDATPAEVEAWKRKYCPQTDAVAPSDYVVVPGVGPESPTVTNAAGLPRWAGCWQRGTRSTGRRRTAWRTGGRSRRATT